MASHDRKEMDCMLPIAEHKLPFTLANPLINLIKARAPKTSAEKTALNSIRMSDTKCSNVMRQGIGVHFAR